MHVQSVQKHCFSLSNMQICGVLLPSSSWLLKLPNDDDDDDDDEKDFYFLLSCSFLQAVRKQ